MKALTAIIGIVAVAGVARAALAQDQPCTAGAKVYSSGTTVCMAGFEQRCINGSWANQQRFCSEDTRFEVIREAPVAVPPVGGAGQPGVPQADKPADVIVPQDY